MPFVVQRVGQIVGTRADRVAVAQYPASSPQVVTLVWNGSHVKYTQWSLIAGGDLYETALHTAPGGPDLAICPFSETRLAAMYRYGYPASLKFEAWKTGGGFELSDDAPGPTDREPEMVTFGADPGILPINPGSLLAAEPELITLPPPVKKVTLTAKTGYAVAASITAGNRLRVSLWGFDNGGDIKVLAGKVTDADGGPATSASIAKVREMWVSGPVLKGVEVVTATRGDGYALTVQRWHVNLAAEGTPASIQLLSQHTAPEVVTRASAVSFPALSGTQVATAVRLEDGTLKVIGWRLPADGSIVRWAEVTGGSVSNVAAAQVRGRQIVTLLRETDGRFKASYWRFPDTVAGTIEHRGDAVEGPIGGNLDCAHVPGSGTELGDTIATTQTEDGKLQIFRYRVTDA